MAIVDGYATREDLVARLPSGLAAKDEAVADAVIEAASRAIDGFTNRSFFKTASQTRIYTASETTVLDVDDLVTVSAIVTDDDGDRVYETTWTSDDYDLEPENAAAKGLPYTRIQTTPNGDYSFPTIRRSVKVTGEFGWPAVPTAIKEATLLQALRFFQRKNAPYGIAGSTDLGQATFIPKLDPDVRALVAPYVKVWIGAV